MTKFKKLKFYFHLYINKKHQPREYTHGMGREGGGGERWMGEGQAPMSEIRHTSGSRGQQTVASGSIGAKIPLKCGLKKGWTSLWLPNHNKHACKIKKGGHDTSLECFAAVHQTLSMKPIAHSEIV